MNSVIYFYKMNIFNHIIDEIVKESIDRIVNNKHKRLTNEVRYIDAASRLDSSSYNKRPYRNNWKDVYNQEPINKDEVIRVYHGCTLKTALIAAIQGLSGKQWTPRNFSYEMGMNPIGLFVSTDFEKASSFSYDSEANVVLEFSVKASQLDTPVWNNNSSYFGQGSNPISFKNADERIAQKEKYQNDIKNDKKGEYPDYVKKSWNPAMAERIFDNYEHQALFYGDLNPNQIKRFWVREKKKGTNYISTMDHFIPYTRSQFIRKFKNTEFPDSYGMAKVEKGDKVFKPNDDFTSVDDLAERMVKSSFRKGENFEKEKKYCIDGIKSMLRRNDYRELLYYIWPKQLRQMVGDDNFFNFYDTYHQLQDYK